MATLEWMTDEILGRALSQADGAEPDRESWDATLMQVLSRTRPPSRSLNDHDAEAWDYALDF